MSTALLAAGDSWQTQLRDAEGQWIDMGSRVTWIVQGLKHTGTVMESSEGDNSVLVMEDDGTQRWLIDNGLTKIADPVPVASKPPKMHPVPVSPSAGAEVIAQNGGVLDTANGRAYFGHRFGPGPLFTRTAAVAAKKKAAVAVAAQMDEFTPAQWLALDKDVFGSQSLHRPDANGNWTKPEDFSAEMIPMMIGQWAKSASDTHPASLALQIAAQREFGLPVYKPHGLDKYEQADLDEMLAKQEPMLRAFVRAQHDATVQQLKADGVTTIKAVRGTSQRITPGNRIVRLNPMSSFTVFRETAWQFATGAGGTTSGEYPRLVWVETPVDKIVGMPGSGVGCLGEYELVLLGGGYRAKVEEAGRWEPPDFEDWPPKDKEAAFAIAKAAQDALAAAKQKATLAAAGDSEEPIDLDINGEEDWIKTLRWDLSEDPRDFTQAQLRELSRLPAWKAAPPQIKAALHGDSPPPVTAAIVRTPAGAKKYGQPIGSVIAPDTKVTGSKGLLSKPHTDPRWNMVAKVWPVFVDWVVETYGSLPETFDDYERLRREYSVRYGSEWDAFTAAGDSWRWQLRDKNGKWIEMGSEVRYLIRGLYKQGIVVGSPSPGVAKVKENITNLLRDIPSNRLEVVESAARVVERVFDVGEREADLQDNPALRDLVERSQKGEVSFIGWGDWLLPDEFGPLTDTIVDLVSSRVYLGQFKSGNVQAEAGQLVYDQIGPKIQELGFDDDSAWYLSQAIGIRITETIHREKQWGTASDRTKTEIAPNLNEVRRTGQIASAVTAETAKQILTDGQFKSQFEVTQSKGLYDPVLRTKYETAMFGMHPHMNKRLRAIYGYVYTPGQETSESLDQYGNMRFLLKPEVRSRTTMTAGDSLGTGALPVAMEGPDLTDKEAFMATSAMPRSIGLAASSPKVFQERDYYEAQIHGGVTLDDVQEIVVTLEHRDYYTQKALDEAILLAEQRGIPVRYETPTRYS